MSLSPQQEKIHQYMQEQSGTRLYKEMAKELKINPHSFRTQLTKLRDLELVKPTDPPENRHWVITSPEIEKAIREAAEKAVKETVNGAVNETVNAVKEPVKDTVNGAVNETVKETGKETGGAVKGTGEGNDGGVKPHPSRESVGLTERQIFEQKANAIGHIPEDKLTVITDMVWEGDPHNLEEVWYALNQTNLAIDIKRMLFASWRSYLKLQGMPTAIPESLRAVTETPTVVTAKEKEAKVGGGLDYIIENGEIRRLPGAGDFTLIDAKEILALQAVKARFSAPVTGAAATPAVAPDKISDLINALTPLLTADQKDETTVKELFQAQIANLGLELKSIIPAQREEKSFIQQLTELKELGPLLKSIFGVSDQPAQGAPAPATVQLQNPDGSPLVMDMTSFLAIKKFEVEAKKEDAAEKRAEKNSEAVRSFMGKISEAASKVAGG